MAVADEAAGYRESKALVDSHAIVAVTQPNKALEPTSGTGAVFRTRPLRSASDRGSKDLLYALPRAAQL